MNQQIEELEKKIAVDRRILARGPLPGQDEIVHGMICERIAEGLPELERRLGERRRELRAESIDRRRAGRVEAA